MCMNKHKTGTTAGFLLCATSILIALSSCSDRSDLRTLVQYDGVEVAGNGPHYEEGRRQFAAGRYGLAMRAFHTALMADGDSINTMTSLASTYDMLGRFDLAEKYYKRALKIDPSSKIVLNNIGYSLILQGRSAEATKYLELARRLDRDNTIIATNLELARKATLEANAIRTKAGSNALAHVSNADMPREVWLERTSRAEYSLVTRPNPTFASRAAALKVDPAVGAFSVVEEKAKTELSRLFHLASGPRRWAGNLIARSRSPNEAESNTQAQREGRLNLIEISNGSGRRHMARRLNGFLSAQGFETAHLTNADNFEHRQSVILAKETHREVAEHIAELLPRSVTITPAPEGQNAALRILLGQDLLEFDDQLLLGLTNG